MECMVDGRLTYYKKQGDGKQAVVLLHGWGMDHTIMHPIVEYLSSDFCVYSFDLPGFGQSAEMEDGWDIEDYGKWLALVFTQLEIKHPIIIAHSFGCRIALWYSVLYPVKEMVLMGPAGIKIEKNGFQKWQEIEYHIIKYVYRFLKQDRLLKQLQETRGSLDYRQASVNMRKTLVKCIHFDLRPYLSSIAVPTLIIIGEKDTATPIWMGKVMEEEMSDAAMIVFEQEDHFACFHQLNRLFAILDAFLEKGEPKC